MSRIAGIVGAAAAGASPLREMVDALSLGAHVTGRSTSVRVGSGVVARWGWTARRALLAND